MATKTMDDFLLDAVKDIYYAERKIIAALKKMSRGSRRKVEARI